MGNNLIDQYKDLWVNVFEDDQEFVKDIFEIGRPVIIEKDNQLISALLLIPYTIDFGDKIVVAYYVYGVVTNHAFRRMGFASQLLKRAHEIARTEGAEYCFLVAADESLSRYYMKLGYSDIIPQGDKPEILHSTKDLILVEKYEDQWKQERVQMISLNGLPIPEQIKAEALLSN